MLHDLLKIFFQLNSTNLGHWESLLDCYTTDGTLISSSSALWFFGIYVLSSHRRSCSLVGFATPSIDLLLPVASGFTLCTSTTIFAASWSKGRPTLDGLLLFGFTAWNSCWMQHEVLSIVIAGKEERRHLTHRLHVAHLALNDITYVSLSIKLQTNYKNSTQ